MNDILPEGEGPAAARGPNATLGRNPRGSLRISGDGRNVPAQLRMFYEVILPGRQLKQPKSGIDPERTAGILIHRFGTGGGQSIFGVECLPFSIPEPAHSVQGSDPDVAVATLNESAHLVSDQAVAGWVKGQLPVL